LAGVLNLSKGEAKSRADQAALLTPRRSLTGEVLPPALPATAAELAAGAIGPSEVPEVGLHLLTWVIGVFPVRHDRGLGRCVCCI
jgi:hypothetical protein